MKKQDILLAILVTFLWGSNYISIKIGFTEAPAFISAAIRCLVTASLCFFIARPKISFKDLYLTSIIFGIFYLSFVYYGVYLGANPSLAVIIAQLSQPFSLIIAYFVLGEKLTRNVIIGVALSIIGVFIIVNNPSHFNGNKLALVFLFLAAIANAFYNIKSREYKEVSTISLFAWENLITAPHLFLLSYFIEGNPIEILSKTTYLYWEASGYTIISGILFLTFWVLLLRKYPVHEVMPYYVLVPFFGILLSVIILHEPVTIHLIVGGLVAILGVYVSQIKPKDLVVIKNEEI